MPLTDQTAAALIADCLETGSPAAWQRFVREFQPLIGATVLRVVRRYGQLNYSIVDDLVQETFLRLCRDRNKALREFQHRHEAAIFGYIKIVAISVANDHFRAANAQKRMGETPMEPEELTQFRDVSAIRAEDSVLLREIEDTVQRVAQNDRDRSIFWLYYRQGVTASDIAKVPHIGLSAKGVESCLLRVTKGVRDEMSGKHGKPKGIRPSSTLGDIG